MIMQLLKIMNSKICDEVFDIVWSEKENMLVSEKEEILEKISKALVYTRIINGEIN